jgi:membrane protein
MIRWTTHYLWPLLRRTVTEWNRDDGSQLAAGLAYYAAFSFFPLILMLIAGLGYALKFSSLAQQVQTRLIDYLGQNTSPHLAEKVTEMLSGVQTNAGYGGPLGLAALLLGAIGIFSQIDASFTRIWKKDQHEPAPSIWHSLLDILFNRLRAFVMLLGLGAMIVLAFTASMALTAARTVASENLPIPIGDRTWHEMQVGIGIALNVVFFAIMFKVLAKGPAWWREAAIGGLVTAAAWEVGRQILALFVVADKYTAYGIVGSFVALMVWFYYASTMLLIGAELVQVACRMRQERQSGVPRAD